ncbi:methionyl-tRNA formyltransferase [Antarcticibacterium flavum]|uniref:Methionyl-tRNA formyltransferase n=1 Tax=Antarcticibacterium flavum TaxID=2058175 RepID=A0A5B7WZY8_9FLAO|nr:MULTISPECIES: methionyl-tRNA formyltransferase [Antarcticibacterium]MCM4158778.1 formyl transferase [Antarcticibacterium sp. W02-3]QCY68629.1 methionyl-tRNA formyltransferase [Antarcticibacterium flavum]
MAKLRIGYFADGPWSHLAFEKIINDPNLEVVFIVPRSDTMDKTLNNYAEKYSIDYFLCANVNSESSIKKIKSYDCDLLVSMSFNQIFRQEIIDLTPGKIINCHAGKLPFFRGRNVLNWALINDEKEFGITVHYVDAGIDTGDIILQRTFPISDTDNYNSLLQIAYKECANILYDSLQMFVENKVKRIPQKNIHSVGMYCGRRGKGDEIVDWNDTSRNVFNFIRSISDPGPQAQCFYEGEMIKINKAMYIEEAPYYLGKPGQILSKTKDGFLVKTKDSFIEIMEINSKLKVGNVLKSKQV